MIKENRVIIVAGETGSGKTTQLPKMCLEASEDDDHVVGCTQPRRIAASSVAGRVAQELGPDEKLVGYKIRFTDRTAPSTRIKFMTDGILLAETRSDPQLRQYSTIIVDEAHERSLNIDFLLGYLKTLLKKRSDLKLLISSATIDTQAFAVHFEGAPILKVSGRNYPVTTIYRPPKTDASGDQPSLVEHCVQAVDALFRDHPRADTLLFLPTERDIRECCELLGKKISKVTVLPMFGRLASADQNRIFRPSKEVKIIVATNVAETSITVPGIRYVVDSGLARISQYNTNAKTTSLPVVRVSRASCDQRAGRCGRIGPGTCIRLFSEEDYLDRPRYTVPEIQRSNLAEVILQMISYKLGTPHDFPFIDPPRHGAIREGYRLLMELGALDSNKSLTKAGRFMASLPVDPCISRILLEAKKNNCLREVKIIAAALAIQDPRLRPAEREQDADNAHQLFSHPSSDFMALLNIWIFCFGDGSTSFSWSQVKKFCKNNYLSFQRMREWHDLHEQLGRIVSRKKGFTDNTDHGEYSNIHKSLLSGFARHLATRRQGKVYLGAHQKELMIFPGSFQFAKSGNWIVAAAFLQTSRLYALCVATIEPDWIEEVVGHLCSYSWTNPRWQKKRGHAVATETVSIFGLTVLSGRQVNFGKRSPKNQAEARRIFIEEGLVNGQMTTTYTFLDHNLQLLEKWRQQEAKLRERNILVDDNTLARFYDHRLPASVYDRQTLHRFLKNSNDERLQMKESDILVRRPEGLDLHRFPSSLMIGPLEVRLSYHFEPGSDRDGVTFVLPLADATKMAQERFEWLVPGLLPEKISYLLKSLPKAIRKKLVPVNETVDLLLDDLDVGRGSLLGELEKSIRKKKRIDIDRKQWPSEYPAHLTPRFTLVDDNGREIAAGRDLQALTTNERSGAAENQHAPSPIPEDIDTIARWRHSRHTSWTFTHLPEVIPLYSQNGTGCGFHHTVLRVDIDSASVRVDFIDDGEKARQMNRIGNLFLLSRQFSGPLRSLKKHLKTALSGPSTWWLQQECGGRAQMQEQALDFILLQMFSPVPDTIIGKQQFDEKLETISRTGFYNLGVRLLDEFLELLRLRRSVVDTINRLYTEKHPQPNAVASTRNLFLSLVEKTFPASLLSSYPPPEHQRISRNLQSLIIRVERCYADPAKDQRKQSRVAPFLAQREELAMLTKKNIPEDARRMVDLYEHLVDEFVISVFSPELGTKVAVSEKKLKQQWQQTVAKC